MKNPIEITEVMNIEHYRQQVNGMRLRDIELMETGSPIKIDEKVYARWEMMGLNNWDFITMKFWEEE